MTVTDNLFDEHCVCASCGADVTRWRPGWCDECRWVQNRLTDEMRAALFVVYTLGGALAVQAAIDGGDL